MNGLPERNLNMPCLSMRCDDGCRAARQSAPCRSIGWICCRVLNLCVSISGPHLSKKSILEKMLGSMVMLLLHSLLQLFGCKVDAE